MNEIFIFNSIFGISLTSKFKTFLLESYIENMNNYYILPSSLFQNSQFNYNWTLILSILYTLWIILAFLYSDYSHARGLKTFINIILIFLLYIVLGVLSTSSNFLVTYLSLESITFIMTSLFVYSSKYDPTAELILKYFTISIFGTIFFLVGISLVYFENKTLDYVFLKHYLNINSSFDTNNSFSKLAVIFILMGFLFKLNSAIFHFWSIEIYGNLSWLNLFIVLVPIKLSMFYSFFKTMLVFFSTYGDIYSNICHFFGLTSVMVGTIGAVFQERLKPFIVYTSISHSGYILLAFSTNSLEGSRAALGHLHGYIFSSSLFFLFIILFFVRTFDSIEYMTDFKKVFLDRKEGILHMIGFLVLSFAGMPPFIGFFTKIDVLITYYNSGNTLFTLLILLVSVISALYYFSVVFEFFSKNYKFEKGLQFLVSKELKLNSISYSLNLLFSSIREGFLLAIFSIIFFYFSICFTWFWSFNNQLAINFYYSNILEIINL